MVGSIWALTKSILPACGYALPSGKQHLDLGVLLEARRLAGELHRLDLVQLAAGHVEDHVDRVHLHQRRQHVPVLVDQSAGVFPGLLDAAVEGGGDVGEAEVELGVVQLGLGLGDGGLGLLPLGCGLVRTAPGRPRRS